MDLVSTLHYNNRLRSLMNIIELHAVIPVIPFQLIKRQCS